ncbi:hypothetical protein HKCCE3408_12835 [Rhodobacterales bacterium HKCCE3408]|nr:hypothetical protein [Rhodobacterales bacterium HKCCE3408]
MAQTIGIGTTVAAVALAAFGFGSFQDTAPDGPPPAMPASLQAPAPASLSAPESILPARVAATALAPLPDLDRPAPVSRFGLACGLSIEAEPRPAASVALRIADPCRPEMRVEIAHEGLAVSVTTDLTGHAELLLPALADPAEIAVRLPGGDGQLVRVPVPDLDEYDRVALAWTGETPLALHAREGGADYGEAGHVWQGSPGAPSDALRGSGGWLARLGDGLGTAPLMAQIYTIQHGALPGGGLVRLSVSADGCGGPAEAATLRPRPDGGVARVDLSFALPACDGTADRTVLQNLVGDLRIAAN